MNLSDLQTLAEQITVPHRHLQYILEQVKLYVPDATVWAFGSRIKGSHRPASDLDLAVLCDKETAKKQLPKLNDIFVESDIPFKVQLLDFNRLPDNMKENIKKSFVVLYRSREKTMNPTLNRLAMELQNMLLNEKSQSDEAFQALLEKMLRVGNGVKIQIYPRDHNPPHFHVEAGNKSASFDIKTGELMQGGLGFAANRIVQQYYKKNQSKLMDIWQNTRPDIILEGTSHILN